jgi:hypothetical protein
MPGHPHTVTREARREMAILGFHSERHRLAMALFGGCVGAAAELAVPTPPPQVSSGIIAGSTDGWLSPTACACRCADADHIASCS